MDTPTVAPGSDPYSEYTPYTRDEKDLAHFGKRQQLRVRLLVSPAINKKSLTCAFETSTEKFPLTVYLRHDCHSGLLQPPPLLPLSQASL